MMARSAVAWLIRPEFRSERTAALLLALVAAAVAWRQFDLSPLALTILVATAVVALLVLLRRFWVWLLGPMFFYDLLCGARRGRNIGLRCIYAGALLAAIFYLYYDWFGVRGAFDRKLAPGELARFGTAFFNTFLTTQFAAVLLLTPVFTAGAIADEKQRRRMDFLLATDLHSREIVCGKWAARLAGVGLLLLTGLPVLAFMQFLGGVEPHLLLVAFAATMLTLLSVGAVGIFASALCEQSNNALWLTYGIVFGFLISCWCLPAINLAHPVTLFSNVDTALSDGDLHVVGMNLAAYAVLHLLAAGLLAFAATRQLRPAIDHASVRRYPPPDLPLRRLPSPGADLAALMPPALPPVTEQPLLWKEVNLEPDRSGPTLRALVMIPFGIIGIMVLIVCLTAALEAISRGQRLGDVVNPMVRGLGSALGCMILAGIVLRAVGVVAREREQQTLDCLLTLPLERADILWAKWLGSVLSVRRLAIGLACLWLFGLGSGALHVGAVVLLVLATAAFAAFAASLGLLFSVHSATRTRALLRTAVTLLVLSLVSLLIPQLLLATPPAAFWSLAFHPQNRFRDSYYTSVPQTDEEELICAIAGAGVCALFALVFWFWSCDVFEKEGMHEHR